VLVIAFSDVVLTGRPFAWRGGRINANAEMLALGVSNVAVSFVRGFPVKQQRQQDRYRPGGREPYPALPGHRRHRDDRRARTGADGAHPFPVLIAVGISVAELATQARQ
jgi:hypothetical protein